LVILRAEVSQFGLENAASAAAEVGAVSEAPTSLFRGALDQWIFVPGHILRKSHRKIRKIVQPIQWVGKLSTNNKPTYSQLPKSWRNPKNLEISLGEAFVEVVAMRRLACV